MSLTVSRTTEPLRFDVGIGSAEYADVISSPGAGEAQRSLLPGATTVSQAMDELFPSDRSVDGEVMRALVAGNPPSLRTPGGFSDAARRTVGTLRGDLNGDGKISVADVMLLLRSILNETADLDSDMNGDGKITLVDVVRLLRAITE